MNVPQPDMPRMQMWFDFASPYSYLAIERIEDLAREAGVRVELRPFLLGPIFQAQGWNDTPFRLFPGKGAHDARHRAPGRQVRRDLPPSAPVPAHERCRRASR